MLMQQVREVMTVNQELGDEQVGSCWLTSEQMGFPLRSEFAKGTRKLEVRNNAMTNLLIKPHFCLSSQISFETRKENSVMKLEDALKMLNLEWSKDHDTRTQCSRFNTSPLHRENAFNKNGPARVKQHMQWEAPSNPLTGPLLLPEREVHDEIGIDWFLDQDPEKGYVRIIRA